MLLPFFSWDEWVPESRVLKFNEANIQKQRELAKQHATLAAKNKKGLIFIYKNLQLYHLSSSPA